MIDFYLKKGDTNDNLVRVLSDDLGDITLSGATVRFQMRREGSDVTKVDALAVIDPSATGKVSYLWLPADVDEPGYYLGEFKVLFNNGKVATFPNGDDYITILIGEGVDDVP